MVKILLKWNRNTYTSEYELLRIYKIEQHQLKNIGLSLLIACLGFWKGCSFQFWMWFWQWFVLFKLFHPQFSKWLICLWQMSQSIKVDLMQVVNFIIDLAMKKKKQSYYVFGILTKFLKESNLLFDFFLNFRKVFMTWI